MKTLKQVISSVFGDKQKQGVYAYHPKTKEELEEIIEPRIKKDPYCDLNDIDVSKITDMKLLFAHSTKFNGDISMWDVSNVKNMDSMFYTSVFNGDISKWDVSNVENMHGMFSYSKFDGNISKWNTGNVKNMAYMFAGAKEFNQDISKWDTSKVEDMSCMFDSSEFFNRDISKWNVSNVKNMCCMFRGSVFDKNISKWKINRDCRIDGIFDYCRIPDKYKDKFKPKQL